MAHGSGMFLMHGIQEVSMPFGPEEGLSKPSTRSQKEPKAETTSIQAKHGLGTFSGQGFGQSQKAELTAD